MSTPIPSEFVGFVRHIGVRAFDRLAARAKDLDPPLRALLKSWTRLSEIEKELLFDGLIDSARMPDAPREAPSTLRQKKPVKRYDPEEVAATLPKKPLVRKGPKPAAKPKAKKK